MNREQRQYLKENEKRFAALLFSLRRQVYVPDEADKRYAEYLAGILAGYELVYRNLMRQQLAGAAQLQVRSFTVSQSAYIEMAQSFGLFKNPMNTGAFVDKLFARGLPSGYSLSGRIWDLKNYSNDIQMVVKNGIVNGLSPSSIARQLDGFILPGRSLTAPTPFGRTVSFDSMRLARTEVMESYRQTAIEQARNSPWITGLLWELSAAHKDLCECDNYADHVYTEDTVPDMPHPQCQCTLTPVTTISLDLWKSALAEYVAAAALGAVAKGDDPYGIGEWMEESFD